jgi:thiol-disulfide isomerase/thioredoxin
MKTRIYILSGVVIVALCAAAGYYFVTRPTPGAETFREEYGLKLKSYDGTDVPLSEFKRSILVVHSWASWCTYCAEELKNLTRLKEMYGDSIEILAINRAESLEEARAFSDPLQLGLGVHILLDPDDSFFRSIGGYAMPETVFIDSNGEVFFHQRGPIQIEDVRQRIQALIE